MSRSHATSWFQPGILWDAFSAYYRLVHELADNREAADTIFRELPATWTRQSLRSGTELIATVPRAASDMEIQPHLEPL